MKEAVCAALAAVRERNPLVQCLTNTVVTNVTANALLAIGASPAMCDTPEESREFAHVANGVLINIGTPSAAQYEGMREAIAGANEAGTPWVLDPVAAGGLSTRTEFARSVVDSKPAAIRGNASEIIALAQLGEGGRGVDATDTASAALPAAQALAQRTEGVVAISGEKDVFVTEDAAWELAGGVPLLQRVIGTGCSLGAITAAHLGTGQPPLAAVIAAHAHVSVAGSLAYQHAQSPGSFAVAWIDALYELGPDDLITYSALQPVELA